MSRPSLMNENEIQYQMQSLPLWERQNDSIIRYFAPNNFVSAIGLINAVAIIAESIDHHPNIELKNWNKIKIESSTHDKGGLTRLDFELAHKIESLSF